MSVWISNATAPQMPSLCLLITSCKNSSQTRWDHMADRGMPYAVCFTEKALPRGNLCSPDRARRDWGTARGCRGSFLLGQGPWERRGTAGNCWKSLRSNSSADRINITWGLGSFTLLYLQLLCPVIARIIHWHLPEQHISVSLGWQDLNRS